MFLAGNAGIQKIQDEKCSRFLSLKSFLDSPSGARQDSFAGLEAADDRHIAQFIRSAVRRWPDPATDVIGMTYYLKF